MNYNHKRQRIYVHDALNRVRSRKRVPRPQARDMVCVIISIFEAKLTLRPGSARAFLEPLRFLSPIVGIHPLRTTKEGQEGKARIFKSTQGFSRTTGRGSLHHGEIPASFL